ncbi:hypothetical protein CR513_17049, partial [Mucuna pruriens]
MASLRLVEKLNLLTLWLSGKGEMVMGLQVSLDFTLGKYIDEILCNVVPIEATHILQGRQKLTLKPFSLREVSEDQLKMKIKREKNKKSKKGKRNPRKLKEEK